MLVTRTTSTIIETKRAKTIGREISRIALLCHANGELNTATSDSCSSSDNVIVVRGNDHRSLNVDRGHSTTKKYQNILKPQSSLSPFTFLSSSFLSLSSTNANAASAATKTATLRACGRIQWFSGGGDSTNMNGDGDGDGNGNGNGNANDSSSIEESEGAIARSLFTKEIKVFMPEMGEGDSKIIQWYKKEGDVVKREDALCDIETPDFTFGMVTDDQEDSIMGKIYVEANSGPVRDDELICTLFHKEEREGNKEEDQEKNERKDEEQEREQTEGSDMGKKKQETTTTNNV